MASVSNTAMNLKTLKRSSTQISEHFNVYSQDSTSSDSSSRASTLSGISRKKMSSFAVGLVALREMLLGVAVRDSTSTRGSFEPWAPSKVSIVEETTRDLRDSDVSMNYINEMLFDEKDFLVEKQNLEMYQVDSDDEEQGLTTKTMKNRARRKRQQERRQAERAAHETEQRIKKENECIMKWLHGTNTTSTSTTRVSTRLNSGIKIGAPPGLPVPPAVMNYFSSASSSNGSSYYGESVNYNGYMIDDKMLFAPPGLGSELCLNSEELCAPPCSPNNGALTAMPVIVYDLTHTNLAHREYSLF